MIEFYGIGGFKKIAFYSNEPVSTRKPNSKKRRDKKEVHSKKLRRPIP